MADAVRLRIAGRVQGVGYRMWLEAEAVRHAIRGWVRNRSDGTVEALLIGDAATLDTIIAACARGPRLASVTGVERFADIDDGSTVFRALPTL